MHANIGLGGEGVNPQAQIIPFGLFFALPGPDANGMRWLPRVRILGGFVGVLQQRVIGVWGSWGGGVGGKLRGLL